MEMNVKPDHRAAGTFIDINTFYIQRVNGKNVAMSFAFSAVLRHRTRFYQSRYASVKRRLALLPDQSQTLAVIRGYQRVFNNYPVPPAGAGWRIRVVAGDNKTFRSRQEHHPTPDAVKYRHRNPCR